MGEMGGNEHVEGWEGTRDERKRRPAEMRMRFVLHRDLDGGQWEGRKDVY